MTTLGQAIEEREHYLAATCPDGAVDWVETVQELAWLRELRARRIAMEREPDDEVNAPADLGCGACGDLEGRCGCGEHDPSVLPTGAEFLEEATAALGGGLELREDMGFCVGCGYRQCICDFFDDGDDPDAPHPGEMEAAGLSRLPVTAPQIQAGIAAGTLICHDAGEPEDREPL